MAVIRPDYMLEKRVGLLLIKLSFPPVVGMIIYSVFSMVDIYIIYRLKWSMASFSLSELLTAFAAVCFLMNLQRELQVKDNAFVLVVPKIGYVFGRLLAWLRW